MKREILCPKCQSTLKLGKYPGEHHKFVAGKVTAPNLVCDTCVVPLEPGAECYALSIWTDGRGIPYYSWESEYMKVTA
jgi:hypothetical protein